MATMVGRKLDQGVLVQMVLEDTQILAVHKVSIGRSAQANTCAEATELDAIECKVDDAKVAMPVVSDKNSKPKKVISGETWRSVKDGDAPKMAVEIPEVGGQEVAGEWLVPHDGILLVSLGVHTMMGEDGKAVVRERLAVLEAEEANVQGVADAVESAPTGRFIMPVPALPPPASPMIQPLRVPHLAVGRPALKIPILPGRSIPQGTHADGTPADAPKMPADEVDLDADSESSEPAPSPQMKSRPIVVVPYRTAQENEDESADEPSRRSSRPRQLPRASENENDSADEPAEPATTAQGKKIPHPKPVVDLGTNKVEFTLPKLPQLPAWLSGSSAPMSGLQFLMPIKPLSIKLPFNQKLEIDVIGKVVPDTDPIIVK
jgi:hypothetical protein